MVLWTVALAMDGHPVFEDDRHFAGHHWVLSDGTLTRDGVTVESAVVGPLAFGGQRVAYTRQVAEPDKTEIIVWTSDEKARYSEGRDRPSRVALDEKGSVLAFVSGRTGWSSVYVIDLVTGGQTQLTNIGVTRRKGGGPPEGFTFPPLAPPRFEGSALVWTTGHGEERVLWR